MANARRPNATYISNLTQGNANLRVCAGSKIPTCWYPQRKNLASGALPNANPRHARYFVLPRNIGYNLSVHTRGKYVKENLSYNYSNDQLITYTHSFVIRNSFLLTILFFRHFLVFFFFLFFFPKIRHLHIKISSSSRAGSVAPIPMITLVNDHKDNITYVIITKDSSVPD